MFQLCPGGGHLSRRDVGGVDTALLHEMVINMHFALLRVRKLSSTLLMSSRSVTKSSGELMVQYSRTSSAYRVI